MAGLIYLHWAGGGYETSRWGYPTGAEYQVTPGQPAQPFQVGTLELQPAAAAGDSGVQFYDCFLKQNYPHHSTHRPLTIDVTGFVKCSDPKLKIESVTKLVGFPGNYCEHIPAIGCSPAPYIHQGSPQSNGNGLPPAVTKNLQFLEETECRNGNWLAETKFTITNANGGKLEKTLWSNADSEIDDCP